ncbi:response regulator transcription factor [Pedomonas mirosovicensis]|uniref:response regulator transcription factor n=1 Tax=Pedomonas mirosovicensis TaxID=2908641 RepID=UPI0021692AA0|nr:response regulator transcription factor [Pedomonas mirosovicensis]MCH8684523.1 response regulator transcription factor [Pedomonas mirosovicensis]
MASKSSLSLNRSPALAGESGLAGLAPFLAPGLITKLSPRLVTATVRLVPEAPPPPAHDLTPRELDVLRGVAGGHSNKVIARQLLLTPETVKWHLKNIMRKLKVNSRHAAVACARQHGFLPD